MHPYFHRTVTLQLYFIFIFIFTILRSSFSTGLNTKRGCPDRCGNLSVPYPFGIGSDCYLNPYFSISCNNSISPSKTYLTIINKEVTEINGSYVRVKYPYLLSACYDGSESQQMNATVNLSGTPYTLSSKNRITAFGCDDVLLLSNGSAVSGGCSTFCAQTSDASGVCPFNTSLGNGCCQAEITGGTSFLRAGLIDLSRKLSRQKLFRCSYAFIQETLTTNASILSYPLNYLNNTTALLNDDWASTSVRLDWMAGLENCSIAKLNATTYACRDEKSSCVNNVEVGRGYLCSCIQGYEGNPYLPGGCQKTSISSSISKLECPNRCGELSIPFPFGIGANCSLAPSFDITCSHATNPPKAYLRLLNTEIILLNSSKIWINCPNLASSCYNLTGNQNAITTTENQRLIIDLSRTQYSLSDENWITAVGCDDLVVAAVGKLNRTSTLSSCAAICSNRQITLSSYGRCPYVEPMYTPGDGCCRAPIPRGTTYMEAKLTDLTGRWPRTNFSCSYAFIEYVPYIESYFMIHGFLNNVTGITPYEYLPEIKSGPQILALDWRIGDVSCKEAQKDLANFACKSNSDCVDFDAALGGYLCNCSNGYQGNPYLTPGCQDIDECANKTTNPCGLNSICINTPGSVYCTCPRGYYGDGRKDGKGCIQESELKLKVIILTGLGSSLGFLLLLLMCFWLYKVLKKRNEKRTKEKFFKRNGGLLLQQQTNEGALGKTKIFPSKELEVATDHFNESRILGHGGQGTVYKGMLPDGKIVAIKKSKLVEENQLEQFINEVVILSQINHRNVVKLLGCCLETEVPLLVYEFMPNGTLFELIHDPNNELPFPWKMRLKIAADIAGALAYLHSASSMPVFHRDVKSSNILLDEKFVVKIADFGTSRSIAVDQTHLTTLVKGTFGYLDPEYFQSSQLTEKSDVYSFGVVLVELLTGQRPISSNSTDEERGLAARFLTCMEEDDFDTILDPQVWEQGRKEEVILVARLAQRCLSLKGKMRPSMKEVATELESFKISRMSVIDEDEYDEEVNVSEGSSMMVFDAEYT